MLTGLRFFLAMYVVVFHFSLLFFRAAPYTLISFLSGGYSAVSMFFALSGYLLAFNHIDGLPLDKGRFWLCRVARLLPAFAISEFIVLISFPLYLYSHHTSLADIAKLTLRDAALSFGFLQGWLYPVVNSPAWSLSCEVFFYLLFPMLVLPVARMGKSTLLTYCVVVSLLSLALPVIYLARVEVPIGRLTEYALVFPTTSISSLTWRNMLWAGSYRFLLFWPIVHLPIFLLGVGLGRFRRAFLANAPSRPKLHQAGFMAAASAVVGVLVFSAGLPHLLLHDSIVGLAFCVCLVFAESAPNALKRVLETELLVFLGEASYALYILQIPFFSIWSASAKYLFHRPIDPNSPGTPAFLICLLLFAAAIFRWVERPAAFMIRKFRISEALASGPSGPKKTEAS